MVGQFHIGRWPAPLRTPADAELLQGLTEAWSVAGIRVRAVDDVAPWKYNKLLSNLGNAVGALSAEGADVGDVRSRGARRRLNRYYVTLESNSSHLRYPPRRGWTDRRHGRYQDATPGRATPPGSR